jgi:hypothetical protein
LTVSGSWNQARRLNPFLFRWENVLWIISRIFPEKAFPLSCSKYTLRHLRA